MKFLAIILVAALSLEAKASGTLQKNSPDDYPLTDSLEHCKIVAEQFRNTCTTDRTMSSRDIKDGILKLVPDMESEPITCSNWPSGLLCDFGEEENGNCKWERKLCVTCYINGRDDSTMIRVQTNNMPDHCPGNSILKPQEFDYNVRFNVQNPEINYELFDEWDATETVCPIVHNYTNTDINLRENGWDESRRALAIAINGVAFQNANDEEDDPVFPIGKGEIAEQPLDVCMGHNQRDSEDGMYHYHFFSPCLNKQFKHIDILNGAELGSCLANKNCRNDTIQWALDGFEEDEWNRRIIALSKDGRPVYGPYDDKGKAWKTTDVDACNGVEDEDYYFYVSTQWHPYISGCQGPTNKIHMDQTEPFYANCSENGIEKYMDDSDCESESFSCATHRHCGDSCDSGSFCDIEGEVCTAVEPALSDITCSDTGGAEGCRTSADCCDEEAGATCIMMICRLDTKPSSYPSQIPSFLPSFYPSNEPSNVPSGIPSLLPSLAPSNIPSELPSLFPSFTPSDEPSENPSVFPSFIPSSTPSNKPSIEPSGNPSRLPSSLPSLTPSNKPSEIPSLLPSTIPTYEPSETPSLLPSLTPSCVVCTDDPTPHMKNTGVSCTDNNAFLSRNCITAPHWERNKYCELSCYIEGIGYGNACCV